MDESTWFLRLVSICLLLMVSFVHGEDVCVQKTPCSCVFPNGTWIDLSSSAKNSTFISATSYRHGVQGGVWLTTFYYHPCHDILMDMTTVNVPASVSRHIAVWNEFAPDTLRKIEESYNFYGTSRNVEFAPDGRYIKYLNPPSMTIVHLVCADIEDQLDIKDLSNPSAIELQFFSRNACLNGNSMLDASRTNNTFTSYFVQTYVRDFFLSSENGLIVFRITDFPAEKPQDYYSYFFETILL